MLWSSFLITFFRLTPIPFEALASYASVDSVSCLNHEFKMDSNSTQGEGMDHRGLASSFNETQKENQWRKIVQSFYKHNLLKKLENTQVSNQTKVDLIQENPFDSSEYKMHLFRHLDW
jgi:hypothetical protein